MHFHENLIPAKVIQRYKRFLVDTQVEDGSTVTAHCANSGSMRTCIEPEWEALLRHSPSPKRKLAYTLELVHNGACWICVNTHRANGVVEEAIKEGKVPELAHYEKIRREVKYGSGSRIDLLLQDAEGKCCYVEVKTVTLLGDNGRVQFPDAITLRGQKHLRELMAMREAGHRAVIFFAIMRGDGDGFEPARQIDPVYSDLLREAADKGVEVIPYQVKVNPEGLEMGSAVAYTLS